MSSTPDSPSARARLARAVAPLALLSVLAGGCASLPRTSAPEPVDGTDIVDDFPRSRLVAIDFVDAMVQLPELAPARTTLYTARPTSRFGRILVASMQQAGYDLRLGDERANATLEYLVRPAPPAAGDPDEDGYTFFVRAGNVRLKRSYRVDVAGVRPVSRMRLHGADATALESSPSLFGAPPLVPAVGGAGEPPELPPGLAATSVRARADGASRAALPPPSTTDAFAAVAAPTVVTAVPFRTTPTPTPTPLAASGDSATASAAPRGAGRPPKRNLYETRRSNYAELLDRHETLRRDVMVFPNDSLRMGPENKRLARRIADAFDPARDVISVIGCSHGATALPNGNERLANGRASRVKEEFVLAGIDAGQVLEEGCWAGTHFELLPARGVVVTHKRRAAG